MTLPCSYNRPAKDILQRINKKLNPTRKEENSMAILSNFFILRVICPAIVRPGKDLIGLKSISEQASRTLVLIAKIIQKLCNNSKFDEEYMKVADDLVQTHIPDFKKVVDIYADSNNFSFPSKFSVILFLGKTKIMKHRKVNPCLELHQNDSMNF